MSLGQDSGDDSGASPDIAAMEVQANAMPEGPVEQITSTAPAIVGPNWPLILGILGLGLFIAYYVQKDKRWH